MSAANDLQVEASYGGGPTPSVITATTGGTTSSTSSASTPAGENGDLLLYFVSVIAGSARTVATPSGFDTVYNDIPTSAVYHRRAACFSRTADGSEGATISAGLGGNSEWTVVIVRIRGWASFTASAAANSSSTSAANPPSHSASWGLANNLWLAAAHANSTVGTAPSGFTMAGSTAVADSAMAVAWKAAADPSENPGAFGTASDAWYSRTLAVEPA